jgi:hypothetical protein
MTFPMPDPPIRLDPDEVRRTCDTLAAAVPPTTVGDFPSGWNGAVNYLRSLADQLQQREGAS